jgi:membrane fusion protein, heavy metal efflux system
MNRLQRMARTLLACGALGLLLACTRTPDSSVKEAEHEQPGRDEHADQTIIPQKIADEVGIRTAPAGSGLIRDVHEVQGLLTPIDSRHAHIRARFPGPLKAVLVGVGDVVKSGQALATIESNVSLADYNVTAPFAGTILDLRASVGELAGDEPLFELADLSSLWVDLHLFGGDAQHIRVGLPVEVVRLTDGAVATTTLERILPGTATASQSTIARASIRNHDGHWRPGTAVRARVTVAERPAKLIVPNGAVQSMEGGTVVFVRSGDTYAARAVKLGEQDGIHTEILDGLDAGTEVVVQQSYLIKADIEKAGAAHEH